MAEALAYVADLVLKKINKSSLEDIQDPEFIKLLDGMNFGKLYGKSLTKLRPSNSLFHSNEGRWVVYPRGSDHKALVKSLEGQDTGWCTAGEATAASQLANGDFHIYYSLDSSGKATAPRIAIRMEGSSIAEVRRRAKNQNIDGQISRADVLKRKLNEFGKEGELYAKKDSDMRKLSIIEQKHKTAQELTVEELRFLYELDSSILSFGYEHKDPRIKCTTMETCCLLGMKLELYPGVVYRFQPEPYCLNSLSENLA